MKIQTSVNYSYYIQAQFRQTITKKTSRYHVPMKPLISQLKIFFLILLCAGCSAIEKSILFKPMHKNNHWKIEEDKHYSHNFPKKTPMHHWSRNQFYSCDSSSSVSINFSNDPNFILWGPPLIPFIPAIPIFDYARFKRENNTFNLTIKISIQTLNIENIDSLINLIHFQFNDSLNVVPMNIKAIRNSIDQNSQNDDDFCNIFKPNTTYSILFKFKKDLFKLKNVTVRFDKDFNIKLSGNYKELNLKKKNKYYYCPFCDNPWW